MLYDEPKDRDKDSPAKFFRKNKSHLVFHKERRVS